MTPSGIHRTAIPSRGWPSFIGGAIAAVLVSSASLFLGGCSQMTVLRTHEIRQVEERVDSTRAAVADVQKSLDALNIQQGGSTNRMRADLTSMLTDLQTQIARLHEEIDETQHRLAELNQKLDKLDKRKVVVTSADTTQGTSAAVKVVPGLDYQKLFAQAREDFIGARYELAFQGFKSIYEKDDAGALREQSLYWMAECLLRADKQDKALETYLRVQTEFPKGTQRCAALLKAGLVYDQKQDISHRDDALNQLIAACPQSNEAARAKEILKP